MNKPSSNLPTPVTPEHEARPDDSRGEVDPDPNAPAMGKWFWYAEPPDDDEKPEPPRLGCVTELGSNYAEITLVEDESTYRVHLDEWDERCRFEPDPKGVIAKNTAAAKAESDRLMGRVQEVVKSLSVGAQASSSAATAQALTVVNLQSALAIGQYKEALVRAQEETLPDLFKGIKDANALMATWMKADLIPLKAQLEAMKPALQLIKERIFNVELYAGLVETVEKIADGKPADYDAPLFVFQRRHYMDEECLVDYEAGGMEFKDIGAFDKWLAKPKHRDRILPFPRCAVAFRVRRHVKDRGEDIQSWREFLNFAFSVGAEEAADKTTFLYLRNGEQLYRLNTEIDFGGGSGKLFPDFDRAVFRSNEPLYVKRDWSEDFEFITEATFHNRQALYKEETAAYKKAHAEWKRADDAIEKEIDSYKEAALAGEREKHRMRLAAEPWHSDKKFDAKKFNDHWKSRYTNAWSGGRPSDWSRDGKTLFERYCPEVWKRRGELPDEPIEPDDTSKGFVALDNDYLYKDEAHAAIRKMEAEHNRLVMVLQGLFDRSPVFVPHPPAKLWTAEGFDAAVKLSFEEDRSIASGAPPDFEAFRAKCNEALKPGSVCIGARKTWIARETERENARRRRREGSNAFMVRHHEPYDNPGPGVVAICTRVIVREGERYAVFQWKKDNGKGDSIAVPASRLLCADGYKPGEYRPFYTDHRTRRSYLKWAPLLLEAEEFHAGNRKPAKPPEGTIRVRIEREDDDESGEPGTRRKSHGAFDGKPVRLKREIELRSGKKYKKGELFRANRDGWNKWDGTTYDLHGINADGSDEHEPKTGGWARHCIKISGNDLELASDVPVEPPKKPWED